MAIHMTGRQRNANKNKKKIFDVSLLLFEQYGFDTVTVDDICDQSGISKGSFYNYFNSKEDLVIVAFINSLDKFVGEHFVLNETAPFREQYEEFVLSMFHFAQSVGKEFTRRSYIAQINTQIELRREDRVMVRMLYALIDRGLKEDAFLLDYSKIELYTHVIGTFTGLLVKWSTDNVNDFDWEQLVRNQALLLLRRV